MKRMKTNNHVFLTLSLFAALLFTACAEDIRVNENEGGEQSSSLTYFTTEVPEETRTSLDKSGNFKWTENDYIYVKDDANTWQRSQKIELLKEGSKARFSLPGKFEKKNSYPVVYSKSFNGTDEPVVTIPSEQVQKSPNNSDHLGDAGDCAWATANKTGGGGFSFTMQHMVSYIMFEPRLNDEAPADGEVLLRKIIITEVTGKDICGKITLDETGVDSGNTNTGDSVITVYCGEDVKLAETMQMDAEDFERVLGTTYGFRIKNKTYAPYSAKDGWDGDHYADGTPLGRVYIVIKPGEDYKFRIDYYASTEKSFVQKTIHELLYVNSDASQMKWVPEDSIALIAQYEEDPNWTHEDTDGSTVRWRTEAEPFTDIQEKKLNNTPPIRPKTYYRMQHKLEVVNEPSLEIATNYQFENFYYMWGAKEWFWKKAESTGGTKPFYPVGYDSEQTLYAPQKGDDSWFYDDVQYVEDGVTGFIGTPHEYDYAWMNKWKIGKKVRHRQANARGLNLWNNGSALTANQMSYYVMYGDPHYDNTKRWVLKYYRKFNEYDPEDATPIICTGGVWLKKKAAIVRDEGITWPTNDDSPKATNLAAPWTQDAAAGQNWQPFEGVQYNLRYCAPWSNYRKAYTNRAKYLETGEWKRPWELDTTKDSLDYFFVPCLGRIEYNNGKPKLTLVGTQGFYWTRTPLAYNFGGETFYYNPDLPDPYPANGTSVPYDYENTSLDNAFYLNIHYNYIALSWQQKSNYMLTGMGVATANSAGFKFY